MWKELLQIIKINNPVTKQARESKRQLTEAPLKKKNKLKIEPKKMFNLTNN